MEVETKHKITSFDMIGWSEPNLSNAKKPIAWLKSLNIETFIYPEETFDQEKPPACIFVPEVPILNKMIETVAKHSGNKVHLYAKFSDMKQPKPQWLIEVQEEEKRKEELAR